MRYLQTTFLATLLLAILIIPLQAQEKGMDKVHETAYEMPRFPGCEMSDMTSSERKACSHQKLMKYIQKELNYPEEAKKENIEGHVTVSFVVTKEGNITSVKALKKLGGGCTEEAIRVVKSMNDLGENWTPGKNEKGKPLNVRYNLPIQFRL
jgi:protein TonB